MDKSIKLYNGDVTLDFDQRLHAYRWGDRLVPGVTKVIGILDKPALVQWAANMACQFVAQNYEEGMTPDEVSGLLTMAKTAHRKVSKSAADIGSAVHAFAEKALVEKRVTLPQDPQTLKGCEAFLGWLHSHKVEPIDCERMVLSRRWYYAGTCDFFGKIDGALCVLDFKTSSGLYLEMLLQLAAYAIALEEETGARIDNGWIVRLDKKTGKCQPYAIPLKNSYRDAFLRVREAHELITRISDEVDGLRKAAA